MQVNELTVVKQEIFSETGSIQRSQEESISTEAGTCSKASARRMKIESQAAQMRVESQLAFDGDLPLNEENAKQRLQYLDLMISKVSGEYADFEVFACTIEKLALHIYLGNSSETVACLRELNELGGVEDSDDEDELSIEGDTAQILLAWAAGDGFADVLELAKYPDPVALLLLKAKGISLPEPAEFPIEDSFIVDVNLEKQLFSRNYQGAIKLLDKQIEDSSELDQELLLQIRGFCKAMLGDYEGALQDYNEALDFDPSYNVDELPIIRGLIHFLKNDPEKARADLIPPCKEGITLSEYRKQFLGLGNFSGFAIAKILDL